MSDRRISILYVGDSWLTAGTVSAFSSLTYDFRGVVVENWAEKILNWWRANPRYQVEYLTGWDALAKFPETTESIDRYDVIFLSDVESDSLVLYPVERSMRAPMGPNRLKLIREFVRKGGALVMIGGYATFTGKQNIGNYHGTPVEEVLPVDCLEVNDDRMETPEGVKAKILKPDHPIVRGIDWAAGPVFNGYNRVQLKAGAEELACFEETGDPLLAVWEFGRGRSMAFTSDIAPHWGAGFQQWPQAERFLDQALAWLTEGKSA